MSTRDSNDRIGSDVPESALPFGNLQAGIGLQAGAFDERVTAATRAAIEQAGYTDLTRPNAGERGATAVVFRAREQRTQRKVALKVILDPSDKRSMQQFRRECKFLTSENLPRSVVAYFGALEGEHQPVIVVEYVEGQSLRDYVRAAGRTVDERIDLSRRLFLELSRLHAAGLFWGDLSLNNIFIDREGQLRFFDFGQGGLIKKGWNSVNSVSGPRGTAGAAPRAVLDGERRPEPRDDVRAAAAVAYRILGGGSVEDEDGNRGSATRSRKQLRSGLVRCAVPRAVAEVVIDTLLAAERECVKAEPTAHDVAERLRGCIEARAWAKRLRIAAALALAVSLPLGWATYELWTRWRAEQVAGLARTVAVLDDELALRPNLRDPAVASAHAEAEALRSAWQDALKRGEQDLAERKVKELLAVQRETLQRSHEIEAAEPLRDSLGEVLERTPWEHTCPTIAARLDECRKRHQVLGAQLDAGELREAWAGLRVLPGELARLASDNVDAQRAVKARADYRQIERAVSQRLRNLPSWQPIATRAAEAEQLLVRGQFDDSAGPGAATEYGQAEQQLEAFLVERETSEELDERRKIDPSMVARLEQRISVLEQEHSDATRKLETLEPRLARAESERQELSDARDALQVKFTESERRRVAAETGSSQGEQAAAAEAARVALAEQLAAADTARKSAEAEAERLRGEVASLAQEKANTEAELEQLRSEGSTERVVRSQKREPKWGPKETHHGNKYTNDIGQTMIWVKPGTLQMGSPESEEGRDSDELLHKVTLKRPFAPAETEVTQKQWFKVMGTRPWRGESNVIEDDDAAASYVSWNDAVEFCGRLTEQERAAGRLPSDFEYRLPTEAEFEYATRAGTTTRYSFGNNEAELRKYAVYDGARDGEYAHSVKKRLPNGWGFFDMHGNVWEWCQDARGDDEAFRDGVTDPVGGGGPQRVYRGGGWNYSAAECRSADRFADVPAYVDSELGFRPVLAARSDVE